MMKWKFKSEIDRNKNTKLTMVHALFFVQDLPLMDVAVTTAIFTH